VQGLAAAAVAAGGGYLYFENDGDIDPVLSVVIIGFISGAVAGSCLVALVVPTLALVSGLVFIAVQVPSWDEHADPGWFGIVLLMLFLYIVWSFMAALGLGARNAVTWMAAKTVSKWRQTA
jgi:hypothetical protein